MAEYLVILSAFLVISHAASAASYDQRQDGKFNVHAKLENLLIVIATSSFNNNDPSTINDLATQVLELKSLPSCENVNEEEDSLSPESGNGEILTKHCKEPYKIEIVPIQKEDLEESDLDVPQKANGKEKNMSMAVEWDLKEDEKVNQSKVNIGREEITGKAVGDLEKTSKRKRARNLWSRLGDPVDFKSSTSLMKELSSGGDQLFNDLTNSGDRNEVGLDAHKPQELILLGGAVENCGPGRYRNRFGVCQFGDTRN